MSLLTMASSAGGAVDLNVTRFSSPVLASMVSAQTKRTWVHFPIRVTQPNLQLAVIFASMQAYLEFQLFVRAHQLDAQKNAGLVTLTWPQRNITGWTGVIRQVNGGYDRFIYAPTADLVVDLVDSLASARTEAATIVDNNLAFWEGVVGYGSPDGVLAPPTELEQQIATGTGPFSVGVPGVG